MSMSPMESALDIKACVMRFSVTFNLGRCIAFDSSKMRCHLYSETPRARQLAWFSVSSVYLGGGWTWTEQPPPCGGSGASALGCETAPHSSQRVPMSRKRTQGRVGILSQFGASPGLGKLSILTPCAKHIIAVALRGCCIGTASVCYHTPPAYFRRSC